MSEVSNATAAVGGAHGAASDTAVIRRLSRYVRPYMKRLLAALAITLALNGLRATLPLFTKYMIDWYVLPRDIDGLKWLALAFLGVRFVNFILFYEQNILLGGLGHYVVYDLRLDLYAKLQRLDLSYYDSTPVGRVLTRLTSDFEALGELFTSCIKDGVGDFCMTGTIIAIMLWTDWRLTLVTLTVLPPLVLVMRAFRRNAQRAHDRARTCLANLNAFLQERLSSVLVLQLLNCEQRSFRQFQKLETNYGRAINRNSFQYGVFVFLTGALCALSAMLVVWYGGWLVLYGTTTPGHAISMGEFAAFVLYSQQLLQPVCDITDKINSFQQAKVAAHHIFSTMDEPVEISSPPRPLKTGRARGHIEFRDVWLAYEGENWVLKGVSFVVEPGQSVAVVGHTGAGKTTLINLLLRFYDPQRGSVLLDGVDVRDWDLQALRDSFAVVLQDVFLFSGTVETNIRLGREQISDEHVRRAAREVHADGFIERLPEGYKTEMREKGGGLSLGQKQLISFARAVASETPVLVLDEATSSVDPETEGLIQQTTEQMMSRLTTFVIAHRLATIQKADRIIVMHDGVVREEGTHRRLLAARGLYWRLYKLQYAQDSTANVGAFAETGEASA
jgi:ATP-binding cassette subfamily B multidrug efflux pump